MSDSLSMNLKAIRPASSMVSETGKLSGDRNVTSYAEKSRQSLDEQRGASSGSPEMRKLKSELADLQIELKAALQEGGGDEAQQKIQMIQAKIDQINARIRELEKQEAEKREQRNNPNQEDTDQAKTDITALDMGALINVKV